MDELTKKVIRLAHTKPSLRPHLLPLLKEAGDLSKLPPALREQAEKKQDEAKKNKDEDEKKDEKEAKKASTIRKGLIRLAHAHPKLRTKLMPYLKGAGDLSKLPPALREQAEKKQEEAEKKKDKDEDKKD